MNTKTPLTEYNTAQRSKKKIVENFCKGMDKASHCDEDTENSIYS